MEQHSNDEGTTGNSDMTTRFSVPKNFSIGNEKNWGFWVYLIWDVLTRSITFFCFVNSIDRGTTASRKQIYTRLAAKILLLLSASLLSLLFLMKIVNYFYDQQLLPTSWNGTKFLGQWKTSIQLERWKNILKNSFSHYFKKNKKKTLQNTSSSKLIP